MNATGLRNKHCSADEKNNNLSDLPRDQRELYRSIDRSSFPLRGCNARTLSVRVHMQKKENVLVLSRKMLGAKENWLAVNCRRKVILTPKFFRLRFIYDYITKLRRKQRPYQIMKMLMFRKLEKETRCTENTKG
jgi:hypothetical protein